MIRYIDFYIDEKTHKIHQFGCDLISTKNDIYLGIYRNLEVALMHAKSKGYIKAFTCNCCNV